MMNANLTENPKLEFKGITIQWERHKNKVICAVYIEGMFNTYGGVARCKDDEFDMIFGMKLSLQRALKDQNKATREIVMEKFGEIYGWGKCESTLQSRIQATLRNIDKILELRNKVIQTSKSIPKFKSGGLSAPTECLIEKPRKVLGIICGHKITEEINDAYNIIQGDEINIDNFHNWLSSFPIKPWK